MKTNPTWLDTDEYPFSPHYYKCEVGDIHYVDEGKGDPIVMVHGNPIWSFSYRHLIKQLSKSHRCIAMDHIGFGLSDKPADWSYLPIDHAKNFEQLMEHLQLKDITLVVNDWGGPIGLSYAIAHPERVKRIVLFNTWLWQTNDDWYYQLFSGFMGGFIGRFLIKQFNFFARTFIWVVYGNKAKLTREIHRHYVEPLKIPAERKGTWVFPKEIIGSGKWLGELWSQIDKIADKPTLILWGLRDIAFRKKELARWKGALHNYTVHTFENSGHYPQEEVYEEVGRLLTIFLEK
ncbi:MAG: alpha/beta fold hydrolase [Chloroflexi bacterium]|uniref:Alpha/beta fold hydrolase n=1 Tax=Candidatus Chlorohelix allophototropha TaxID=3003348 RepID=A0A8T7M343_9CHLR|nr:alpha/beta fold hydrolase [Chloroflexota bacterium]WJW67180.1 alpha/beta fold hydrolase [Chloroflexota bacterium L227-S17]